MKNNPDKVFLLMMDFWILKKVLPIKLTKRIRQKLLLLNYEIFLNINYTKFYNNKNNNMVRLNVSAVKIWYIEWTLCTRWNLYFERWKVQLSNVFIMIFTNFNISSRVGVKQGASYVTSRKLWLYKNELSFDVIIIHFIQLKYRIQNIEMSEE